MKIRNGFVSNSSSSSFILIVKKSEHCSVCGRSDPNFIDLIEKSASFGDRHNRVVSRSMGRGIDDLSKVDWYCFDDEALRYFRERLEKDKAQIESDEWEVAEVTISYHDEKLQLELCKCVKNGTVIIVLDEDEDFTSIMGI
jgi:hypothetical protein